jgi:Mor family transcriptional regulator
MRNGEILRLAHEGWKVKDLARKFNVSSRTVQRVVAKSKESGSPQSAVQPATRDCLFYHLEPKL